MLHSLCNKFLTRCKVNNGYVYFRYSTCSSFYKSIYRFSSSTNTHTFTEVKPEFCRAKLGSFYQEAPQLDNPFVTDFPLQRYLKYHVPEEVRKEITRDLNCFGNRIVHEIDHLGLECELNPPSLKTQDAWGTRIDELTTCNAWKKQHNISAEEGLVAIGYERKLIQWSRLHQVCKLYLYAPSAGLFTCPLAMTDGAAKTIEVGGQNKKLFKKAFDNLTTRDPSKFWTSGQWMTERRGGSDVSAGTETIAVPEGDFHRLYGYKWFTSATDSNMSLTLAREIIHPETQQSAKGLTLFYLETRNNSGHLNHMQLIRLKNKLGTRQVPTAELLLDGSVAYKMSKEGHGISAIANMLNITRLYNSIGAVSAMRRITMLARDYSQRRVSFGKTIGNFPLHMQVLSRMEVEVRGCLVLLLKVAIMLGKEELCLATPDEILLLRLMLPVLKLYSAKQAISVVSEGLEAFGGQGYMEDTGLPLILRDSQVLSIWEGTTNIMSLDVLRSFSKTNLEVLNALERNVEACLDIGKQNTELRDSCIKVENSIKYVKNFVHNFPQLLSVASREISYSIARSYIGALLIENASLTRNETDFSTAQRWCQLQDLCPLSIHHNFSSYEGNVKCDSEIVMEGYKAA